MKTWPVPLAFTAPIIGVLCYLWSDPANALDLVLTGEAEETIRRHDERATLQLAIGPYLNGKVESLTVQGQFVQSAWRLTAMVPDTAQIADDLGRQFSEQGYQILFSCQTGECGGFDFRYNAGILPAPEMYVDLGDFRYLVARKGQGDTAEHLALVVSRAASTGYVQLTRVATSADLPRTAAQMLTGSALPTRSADPVQAAADPLLIRPETLDARLDQGLPVALDDLVFAPGSSQLTDGAFASISELAGWMNVHPKARLILVGHTDDIGSLQANVKVSRLRAEAVRQRLLFLGEIDPTRVTAEGAGYLAPRQTNQTEAGRQQNRRVEAVPLTSTP